MNIYCRTCETEGEDLTNIARVVIAFEALVHDKVNLHQSGEVLVLVFGNILSLNKFRPYLV